MAAATSGRTPYLAARGQGDVPAADLLEALEVPQLRRREARTQLRVPGVCAPLAPSLPLTPEAQPNKCRQYVSAWSRGRIELTGNTHGWRVRIIRRNCAHGSDGGGGGPRKIRWSSLSATT